MQLDNDNNENRDLNEAVNTDNQQSKEPVFNGNSGYTAPANAGYNMYTPGICANQPPVEYQKPVKPPRSAKSGLSSFFLALCIVVVCSVFSAAATYLVIEYRIARGDFAPVTNHVVLGAQRPADFYQDQNDDSYTAPLGVSPEDIISAQDIYDIALTQVIGISITPPESSNFFGFQGSVPSVTGSGFIISADGYILTNYHVVNIAHSMKIPINVVLHDGSSYEAEVVGFEESSDVAVIKIDATDLSPAFIGNSDNLRVGQDVYAVGNPFGDLVYTMTDGIISALDRVVTVEGKTISTFQFSAAVNSGNSGGPVYNTSGEVIGIVTAKVIRGNVEGIGFAIPINDAIDIATALIEHGYISGRPQLGVTVQNVSPSDAKYYDWVVGVYVRGVTPDSAADKAGIKVGDIIIAIADDEVDTLDMLRFTLRKWNAGDTTTITVWRGGETKVLPITFNEDLNAGKPEQTPPPSPDSPDPFKEIP